MSKYPLIVGISGKRGAGKTTAADYLVKMYGFTKVSFAALLKEQAKLLFPFSREQLYGSAKEKKYKKYDWTPRDFMIKFGQFLRYWDQDYWIKYALLECEKHDRVVIDDLRYQNEANILKAAGAKLIRIRRYKNDNPFFDKKYEREESECQLDDYGGFDEIIHEFENKAIPALHKTLDYRMKKLEIGEIR